MNRSLRRLYSFFIVLALIFSGISVAAADEINPYFTSLSQEDWMQGDLLLTMKQRLYELGYFTDTDFTGRINERTKQAISEFQEMNGLPATGSFSSADYYAMFSLQARKANGEITGVMSSNTQRYIYDTPAEIQNVYLDGSPAQDIRIVTKARSGEEPAVIQLESRKYNVQELTGLVTQQYAAEEISDITVNVPSLTLDDAVSLVSGFSASRTHIYFTFADTVYCTDMQTVFVATRDLSEKTVEKLISAFPDLARLEIFAWKVSNAKMLSMMEKYPDISFGWSVTINNKRFRNDITAYSTLGTASRPAEYYEILQYVPNLKGLDLGHNKIRDLEFLRFFPDLKVLILADNQLTS